MQLRHVSALLRAQGRAAQGRKIFKPAFLFYASLVRCVERQIAIVNWLDVATFVLFNITTADDPIAPQRFQSFAHVSRDRRVSIRAARFVDADWWIVFQLVFEVPRRVLIDLAERNAHAGLCPIDVYAA